MLNLIMIIKRLSKRNGRDSLVSNDKGWQGYTSCTRTQAPAHVFVYVYAYISCVYAPVCVLLYMNSELCVRACACL